MEIPLNLQIVHLFLLAIPIACIAWTVTHEEVFREPREYCVGKSKNCRSLFQRKFFYLFTCEYCFSHWVTILLLLLTGFRLLIDDWRGYVLAFFTIPWIANQFMSVYRRLRIGIKHEAALTEAVKKDLEE